MRIALGSPSEAEAREQFELLGDWIRSWRRFEAAHDSLKVSWTSRRWRSLGLQELPAHLLLESPTQVAELVDQAGLWRQAQHRFQSLVKGWPACAEVLSRHFEWLARAPQEEVERLTKMVTWLLEHPASGLYPRQIPLAGMDSKWLEHHQVLTSSLLAVLRPGNSGNWLEACGLRPLPEKVVRLRLLDPELRARLGGLGDLSLPWKELEGWRLPVRRVFIVENLQSALAFHDLPGSLVFMALGYDVQGLGRLPWLSGLPCICWGDIDTHGLAILARLRKVLPQVVSLMMDEETLLYQRDLWVEEPQQNPASELAELTETEADLYRGLKEQRWGQNVRLEQERIAWDRAWEKILDCFAP